MTGIVRLASYFPRRRLDRALMAKAWGTRASGTRATAGIDEDALTMAADAVQACLAAPAPDVDALYFASTSAPYLEKQVASVVATVVDLPRTVAVADFGGSVRAGLAALRGALDGVRAGSLRTACVVAADARLAEPDSELEPLLGDAASAALVGAEGVIAELVSAASVAEEFTHLSRTDRQTYVELADGRFGVAYGFVPNVTEAVTAACRRAEIPPGKVAQLALAAPDARAAGEVAKKLGVDAGRVVAGLIGDAGLTGTPDPLLLLSRALETAAPGDFVVVAAFGEGADALVFRATDRLPAGRPAPLGDRLARGLPLPSYERYLRARGVLPVAAAGEAFNTYFEWKELKQDVRLYGSRCEECGTVQYPQARVCVGCRKAEKLVDQKLARRGRVFTYTIDNLAPSLEHPMPMAVIDLDGGGRVYLQMTDTAEGECVVGAPVELTYRRLAELGETRNYFWKARPTL